MNFVMAAWVFVPCSIDWVGVVPEFTSRRWISGKPRLRVIVVGFFREVLSANRMALAALKWTCWLDEQPRA